MMVLLLNVSYFIRQEPISSIRRRRMLAQIDAILQMQKAYKHEDLLKPKELLMARSCYGCLTTF